MNKNYNIILSLKNKIDEIESRQILIKEFERQIEINLIQSFPNISKSLDKNDSIKEWVMEILNCENSSNAKNVLSEMEKIESELNLYNSEKCVKYTEESMVFIGDENKVLLKQIEALKHRFDDVISYLKEIEKQIITIENKIKK